MKVEHRSVPGRLTVLWKALRSAVRSRVALELRRLGRTSGFGLRASGLLPLSLFGLLLSSALPCPANPLRQPISLAGEWRFALDRTDVGVREGWFQRDLPDRIQLPGVLQAQGYGDQISTNTPWVLSLYDKQWFQRAEYQGHTEPGNVRVPFLAQPPRHYLGAAWYQREVDIPTNWLGRRVVLFLERTQWETRAWLGDRLLGTNDSLCVPHEFEAGIVGDAPGQLPPGRHRLTVRVDNRMQLPYRPDAHAVSDSLGATWNGIVGRIELRSTTPVWIEDVRLFPEVPERWVRVKLTIGNRSGAAGRGRVLVGSSTKKGLWSVVLMAGWDTNGGTWEGRLPYHGGTEQDWDEFQPKLQDLTLHLYDGDRGLADDERKLTFGFRSFQPSGRDLLINGRPTHLRGTHHGGDFPLTGHPPCDVDYWRNLWRTCKEWGLNHVRFHSYCPPEAAFTAADELGLYLQIEPGMWNTFNPGTDMETRLYRETERILRAYGNHPSFVLMAASNEPKGRWRDVLPQWAAHFRERDPRRLYTTGTGFTDPDAPGPLDRVDFTATQRFGGRQVRGATGWFGGDYRRSLEDVNVPVLVHENGQWCAYPDYDVIRKFTGYLRPGNYEIFRASAERHGLPIGTGDAPPAAGSMANDGAHGVSRPTTKQFAHASGRFQLACYKEEVEANLRTPGLAGFQLLDLHDYLGQGTALVGVLDPFWEEKGYVKADEWREFCSPVVPLARLPRRVFTTADTLDVPVDVANYSAAGWTNVVLEWDLQPAAGGAALSGRFPATNLAVGRHFNVAHIRTDLVAVRAPTAALLTVRLAPAEHSQSPLAPSLPAVNSWPVWIYPASVDTTVPESVLLTSSWAEAEARLAAGGRVLYQPPLADLDWASPPLDRVPIFWNRLMSPGWSRMLGLWCDAAHPALAGFPTRSHCDWQWTELIRTRALNLERLPEVAPIVAAIDDWNRNWPLACLFEARVGDGRLLVTTFDLGAVSPVAKQLRRSLLDYAAGEQFRPTARVTAEQVRALWFDTLVMRKLGASGEASHGDARAALDGDPNTAWIAAGGRGNESRRHPHELTITFTNAVPMDGLVLMNRQNDRDRMGDVREYRVSVSEDGQEWREVLRGELPSTWSPQTLRFPERVTASRLRFTALSGYGADNAAALAELAVLYAGPPLPPNEGRIEYRRSRSTATDVDEGGTP